MKLRIAIPSLIKGLADKSDLVRSASARALYKIRLAAGPQELTPHLKDVRDKGAATVLRLIIDDKFKKKIKNRNAVKSD
jgi:HEAT repeat protein